MKIRIGLSQLALECGPKHFHDGRWVTISVNQRVAISQDLGFERPRASSQAERGRIKAQFMKDRGLRKHDGHACIYKVMGKRCVNPITNPCDSPRCVPVRDGEPVLFQGRDGFVMAFQPWEFYEEDRVRLTEYCRLHGLKWEEPWKDSWRYPGWSTLIMISKA